MDAMTELLDDIAAYIQKTGITRARFGTLAGGNHQLIERLEAGAVTWGTMQRVRSYIEKQNGTQKAKG